MSLPIRNDLYQIDSVAFPYIYEENATVTLRNNTDLIRCNVYRPKGLPKAPVLVTYGPYGKDIPYRDFHPKSFSEVNPEHKSEHSAWETPDPGFWTNHGYAIVRADERGTGQSPGLLDTMSRGTSEAFFDVIEWAAEQPWSTGKVGLLGISYYAGSQWRVAARRPKGLACIIPWEGMSDYYRDRCRHGGILSNAFIKFWWDRQVVSNQYGKAGKKTRNWGPDTLEGDLSEEQLAKNRQDQNVDNAKNQFRDDPYYASKEYSLEDIQVPLLSVANWGGILLHLRGNVEGYVHAGSRLKYLRFITGRHDLPFYYPEEVEIQRSFLDAFLKDDDRAGWSNGQAPKVDLVIRKGNPGYNNASAEKAAFPRRIENEWPIARTQYTRYYLTSSQTLTTTEPRETSPSKLSYHAPTSTLSSSSSSSSLLFITPPFSFPTEITGPITAHLHVSLSPDPSSPPPPPAVPPSEIDLFLTLHHYAPSGREIAYTGTTGSPVPLAKGWLRVSLRQVNTAHPRHRAWLPYRDYFRADVQSVRVGEVYAVDVEVWPTCCVVEKGGRVGMEVAAGDTGGEEIFGHDSLEDR